MSLERRSALSRLPLLLTSLLLLAANGSPSGAHAAQPEPQDDPLGARSPILAEPAPSATLSVEAGTRLYAAADPHAPTLSILDLDVELEVLEERAGWARVRWGQKLGWIRLDGTATLRAPLPAHEALRQTDEPVSSWSPVADAERLQRARGLLGGSRVESRLGPFLLLTDVQRRATLDRFSAIAESLPAAFEERLGLAPRLDVEQGVVLFADEARYRAYEEDLELAGRGVAGHAGRGVAALFVGGRPSDEIQSVLVHELTHLLNRLALGRDLPAWLEEGLANDLAYSATRRDGSLRLGTLNGEARAQNAGAGRVVVHLTGARAALRTLQKAHEQRRLEPIPRLLDLAWSELVELEGREERYVQSAFLVRFLLDGNDSKYAPAFRDWLADLARGGGRLPGDLLEHLDLSSDRLTQEFLSWLQAQSVDGP